jgi:hypothetical protein
MMTNRPALLPDFVTPEEFADHFGVGERWVRDRAREIGACCILSKKMRLFSHHIEKMLEASECPSHSTNAEKSGTTEVLFPEGNFAALQARLKESVPKGSKRKSKAERGSVVSMARARG